jgi:putative zinc finger/helix-turn-helix YgiT family protein
MIMKGVCPNCEKISELEHIITTEEVNVRGDLIKIEVEYYKCTECGEEFEDPGSKDDPLEKAYREYRRKHGMIQPEEISEMRKLYGLTQQELSKLIGWGGATISRYENGALQDHAHDRVLQLIRNPENLQKLVNKNGSFLPEKKRERFLNELSAAIEKRCSLPNILSERFGKYEPSIESGYKNLDLNKLFQMIIFFAKDGVLKSKLCKLIFYADFKCFKDYAISISGAKYAHAHHGPVPDNYEYYFATLIHDEKAIRVEEIDYGEYLGEKFYSESEPDLSVFSDNELEVLLLVKKFFQSFNATKIREFSHNEKGYNETKVGDIISFEYSNDLQI